MNAQARPLPRDEAALRQETVAWYARLCSGEATEADHQAWQQWHQQHPDHQRAWQRIATLRSSMQRVPARIALPTLQAVGQGRRQVLRSALLLATGGTLAYAVYRSENAHWQTWLADYHTHVGEQRRVVLADGSVLLLNTDSAVDVDFSDTQRLLRLRSGELLVETAKHRQLGSAASNSRPFEVHTAQGSVRALGTRFTVRLRDDRTEVLVLDDAVEVRPLDAPDSPVRLQAGQQLSFSRSAADTPQPADDTSATWEFGSLVVSDQRLDAVVAELARYRPGHLACAPAVAGLRVSGAFPLADTDKALAVLAKSFSVRIRQRTRYWVSVEPA